MTEEEVKIPRPECGGERENGIWKKASGCKNIYLSAA